MTTTAFRSTLPNGVVVSTVALPRAAFGPGMYETAIVAPSGAVSDGIRSKGKGMARVAHNSVCDGVYGRGVHAEQVLSMLLDVAADEVAS